MELFSILAAAAMSASPEGSALDQDLRDLMQQNVVPLADETTKCVDLTGTWAGTCSLAKTGLSGKAETDTFSETFTVAQTGCGKIDVKGMKFEIGVATAKADSSEHGFRHTSLGTYWKDDGAALGYAMEVHGMRYGEQKHTFLVAKGQMAPVEGQENTLKVTETIKVKKATGDAAPEKTKYEYSCELTRGS